MARSSFCSVLGTWSLSSDALRSPTAASNSGRTRPNRIQSPNNALTVFRLNKKSESEDSDADWKGPNHRWIPLAHQRSVKLTSENDTMNTEVVVEVSRAALAGTMSFPDAVRQLLAAGVEYYHVDYVGLQKSYYSAEGHRIVTTINYEGLPPVAADFDGEGLRAAILDSQRQGLPYRDFTRRAMTAGVQGYIAFLRGQRVMYWGRSGDQHIEWFPGAKK